MNAHSTQMRSMWVIAAACLVLHLSGPAAADCASWNERVAQDWAHTEEIGIRPGNQTNWANRTVAALDACERLAREFGVSTAETTIRDLRATVAADRDEKSAQATYLAARRLQRGMALKNPRLRDFDSILFTKRVPGSVNHMADQFYGWWSRPGGGIYVLRDFAGESPLEQCLTGSFREPGSFLRATLSYDATKVLFAWCRHYPGLAAMTNKMDKANVPEDAFYHLFEMNVDGSGVRQLTRGKYDDFDGRYLPDGRIVFVSTRRGQSIRPGAQTGAATMARADLPDSYARCGGGPERPMPVFTLHIMAADGSGIAPLSPFDMCEWNPEIGDDGGILYSRWDCLDRDSVPYIGLWTINPDGSNARSLYKNYTKTPQCVFEAKPIPGSRKIVFTASAHHSQTMGSLVMLDPTLGTEGAEPIRRLTPEVVFAEAEGWPLTHYSSPWPLSERFYLVAWGDEGARVPGPGGSNRWASVQRPANGTALYLYDAELRTRELLWTDALIGCTDPVPLRSRACPPAIATQLVENPEGEGAFFVADVYRGMTNIQRGEIRSIRIVAVAPKPAMDLPRIGITGDDPGKYVLGTVPVERDGSAYFNVPAGIPVLFQVLDSRGVAVQTMRSVTHVLPGQTLGCIGCHEHRQEAPFVRPMAAGSRPPSSISPGPRGSWPLRYDRLVQPVLNVHCVRCHDSRGTNALARRIDLTAERSYETLVSFGKPSISEQVKEAYLRGTSVAGDGIAEKSRLVALLAPGHQDVEIDGDGWDRLLTWLDTCAQRVGYFSEDQEDEIDEFRRASAHLFGRRIIGRGPMLNSKR